MASRHYDTEQRKNALILLRDSLALQVPDVCLPNTKSTLLVSFVLAGLTPKLPCYIFSRNHEARLITLKEVCT